MTQFFTLGNINELVLQGHSYISEIGLKLIDDKNCKGSSFLEGHFYSFLDLLEIIEERKDLETDDDRLQQLVLRLYGYVNNECIYYNGRYLDIDSPMFNGSVTVDTSDLVTQEQLASALSGLTIGKTRLDIIDNINPTVIDWNNDIVPTPGDGRTYAAKHGRLGYSYSAKWYNGSSYEKNDGFSIVDTYDGSDDLELVTINVSDVPFRFIII